MAKIFVAAIVAASRRALQSKAKASLSWSPKQRGRPTICSESDNHHRRTPLSPSHGENIRTSCTLARRDKIPPARWATTIFADHISNI